MSTAKRIISATSAEQIFNSRKPISIQDLAQASVYKLRVAGVPTLMTAAMSAKRDVELGNPPRKQYFDQYIYNLNVNSMEVVARPETKALLMAGLKAESTGNVDAADENLTKWLNACQLSFAVIANPNARVYANGDDVKITFDVETTKTGYQAIVVKHHSYIAPAALATKKFSITDFVK